MEGATTVGGGSAFRTTARSLARQRPDNRTTPFCRNISAASGRKSGIAESSGRCGEMVSNGVSVGWFGAPKDDVV